MTATEEPQTEQFDVEEPADDDLFDQSFEAPKRTNKLTVVLVVALLVVAGFATGVSVQKKHDTYLAAVAVGAEARRGGGNGTGGGRGQGAPSSTAPGATGAAGGGAASGAPVVEGTIRTVNKDSMEVDDPSGAIIRVFVPATATVTARGLGGLAYDQQVSITGTREVDGSVTATSVTVKAG